MTAITYDNVAPRLAKPAAPRVAAGKGPVETPKRESLLRKIFEGIIEGRRLEAEMMVKHHMYGSY